MSASSKYHRSTPTEMIYALWLTFDQAGNVRLNLESARLSPDDGAKGGHQSKMNFTRTKFSALSMTSQRCRTWIDVAIRRNWSGRRLASESSNLHLCLPSGFARQSIVRIGSPKTADATLNPTRGFIGSAGIQLRLKVILHRQNTQNLNRTKTKYLDRSYEIFAYGIVSRIIDCILNFLLFVSPYRQSPAQLLDIAGAA